MIHDNDEVVMRGTRITGWLVFGILAALILLLISLAGLAVAADDYKIDTSVECKVLSNPHAICVLVNGSQEIVDFDQLDQERHCLTKMEAAMQAMEPFVYQPYPPHYGASAHGGIPATEGLSLAWGQWNTVKRECWRGP
jgi:hypothetical protein